MILLLLILAVMLLFLVATIMLLILGAIMLLSQLHSCWYPAAVLLQLSCSYAPVTWCYVHLAGASTSYTAQRACATWHLVLRTSSATGPVGQVTLVLSVPSIPVLQVLIVPAVLGTWGPGTCSYAAGAPPCCSKAAAAPQQRSCC